MTLSFKTINNYQRYMPELKITTHSKMKKFTDMDSSKLYGKKRKKMCEGVLHIIPRTEV